MWITAYFGNGDQKLLPPDLDTRRAWRAGTQRSGIEKGGGVAVLVAVVGPCTTRGRYAAIARCGIFTHEIMMLCHIPPAEPLRYFVLNCVCISDSRFRASWMG
jgi:hypothetical protein